MSYILEVLVPATPGDERLAWIALASERANQIAGAKAAALTRLHEILVSVYPCLSSYLPDDPTFDECPWSEGNLIDRVGSRMATLGLRAAHVDHVLDFIVTTAGLLGLTVFDRQRGHIYRPPALSSDCRYEIHIHGVRPGYPKDQVVTRVAQMFDKNPLRIRRMLDTPRTVVKKGSDHLSALRCQAMLSKLGCSCSLVVERATTPRPAAEISLSGGNQLADLQRLRHCAKLGHAESQYQLGFLLLRGLDFPQDSVRGAEWVEKAAEQGHCEAQWTLAFCYREGDGVFKSYVRSLEWMRKAALQGDPQAQTSVGRIYWKGEGVQPDLFEARCWFQRAAAQGDSQGQYLLGKMLDDGRGCDADHHQAAALFTRAAQRGNLDAKLRLHA